MSEPTTPDADSPGTSPEPRRELRRAIDRFDLAVCGLTDIADNLSDANTGNATRLELANARADLYRLLEAAQAEAIFTAVGARHRRAEDHSAVCDHDLPVPTPDGEYLPDFSRRLTFYIDKMLTARSDTDPATAIHLVLFEQQTYWRTNDGRVLRIDEMDTSHLLNTIDYLQRTAEAWLARKRHVDLMWSLWMVLMGVPEDAMDRYVPAPADAEAWMAERPAVAAMAAELDARGGRNLPNRLRQTLNNRTYKLRQAITA